MRYIAIAVKYLLKYLFLSIGAGLILGLLGWICWFWFRGLLTPLLAMAVPAHGWIGWLWAILLALICLGIVTVLPALLIMGVLRQPGPEKQKERKE